MVGRIRKLTNILIEATSELLKPWDCRKLKVGAEALNLSKFRLFSIKEAMEIYLHGNW